MEGEKDTKVGLKRGFPSRVHVPVFHWTGFDNGVEQEYGVLLYYWAEGEFLKAKKRAGTLGLKAVAA